MSKYLKEPAAFPSVVDGYIHDGMSLRDYFAAKAMQGIIIRFGEEPPYYILNTSEDSAVENEIGAAEAEIARYSYEIADMMMLAREE